ncbi:MAG: IS21-like element helper ATPase IstB [Candidatus Marinimicrobia bacterium]|nr:IS21-like element helper ATPase IstB [Candidatus Neomarinimicrobiota bacterium]
MAAYCGEEKTTEAISIIVNHNLPLSAELVIQNNLSYEQYLLTLVEQEIEERNQSRTSRLQRESKLPLEKTISIFDRKRLPEKVNHLVGVLLKGKFTEKQENVLAFGNPGSGKTHLLCAIGHELILQGKRVFFSPCSLLVQNFLAAKRDLTLSKYLKKLAKYDAIIIDDIGYVQQSREEMEVLFTLLADRYEKGSIMITSNLPFSKWDKICKDPMTTAAAIDRLVHHSVILELNINSYRLETAGNILDDAIGEK